MRLIPYLRNTFWKVSKTYYLRSDTVLTSYRYLRTLSFIQTNKLLNYNDKNSQTVLFIKNDLYLNSMRFYSKKKKSKKAIQEEDEEESDDEESFESLEDDVVGDNHNIVSKSLPSLRIDTVAKAAFGITKKKVEKEFYASNLRLNGVLVLKKSLTISEGDEVDIVKGYSPDNDKFLLVDRVLLKGIGKISSTGLSAKMQVFKGLTIENYADPWVKSSQNVTD